MRGIWADGDADGLSFLHSHGESIQPVTKEILSVLMRFPQVSLHSVSAFHRHAIECV